VRHGDHLTIRIPLKKNRLFVELVARRTSPETVVELTTRNTVSRTSVVAGRTKLF
jgi:hypothetical protein